MSQPDKAGFRKETDSLGTRDVPADAYYGVQTLRASENFQITGVPLSWHPVLIRALASVKQAAALANFELGLLPGEKKDAIVFACEHVREGKFDDQFVVDMIQGGAGTSTNMAANEIIANVGLEHMGYEKGDYAHLHPNEDVNMSQSTNDVYPTALRIATIESAGQLQESLRYLRASLERKAAEFADVLKVGRTQLQDAVPMTLGQEFGGWATTIGEDEQRITVATQLLHEINLGATAIGTGINAHPDYPRLACQYLCDLTGYPLATSPNLIEATWDCGSFVMFSGTLRRLAVKVSKICNDLRLLSSGPRAGFGEITLPPRQAGSSIMPGKINPVIPEAVNQVAFEVIGNDVTVTMAAEAGQLQLNAFEPIIGFSLFKSVAHMRRVLVQLADLCIDGITANLDVLAAEVASSIGLATALNPRIGYDAASRLAKRALKEKRSIAELVLEEGLIEPAELQLLLAPDALAHSIERAKP